MFTLLTTFNVSHTAPLGESVGLFLICFALFITIDVTFNEIFIGSTLNASLNLEIKQELKHYS